jgi:hypothetical protein
LHPDETFPADFPSRFRKAGATVPEETTAAPTLTPPPPPPKPEE